MEEYRAGDDNQKCNAVTAPDSDFLFSLSEDDLVRQVLANLLRAQHELQGQWNLT
jgi:hypothetical protein